MQYYNPMNYNGSQSGQSEGLQHGGVINVKSSQMHQSHIGDQHLSQDMTFTKKRIHDEILLIDANRVKPLTTF